MTTNEYLQQVLQDQNLADNSTELEALQGHRKDVEVLLRSAFPQSSPTIRYGGSRAKGTLIREAYDLDIICYFEPDDTSAGDGLEDIYNNVKKALEANYMVTDKTSALRLKSKARETMGVDFHIDVVPGRFIDNDSSDCYIHQNCTDKCRLKTNLDVHIAHIKDSGVIPAIRLLKLWKYRKAIDVRQFAFELMIIKLLEDKKNSPLSEQLEHVWTEMSTRETPPAVEDPANPHGNDLSELLNDGVWSWLSITSKTTLEAIKNHGWESVFGSVKAPDQASKQASVSRTTASISYPTKPWCAR
jgi:hypothetical protein